MKLLQKSEDPWRSTGTYTVTTSLGKDISIGVIGIFRYGSSSRSTEGKRPANARYPAPSHTSPPLASPPSASAVTAAASATPPPVNPSVFLA